MIRTISLNTVTVLKDLKFVTFLLIIIGFWTMYMQLFFTVPVYIGQWTDTTVIYEKLGFLRRVFGSEEAGAGLIRPEMMINIPALTIILFQLVMSALLKGIRPVGSMVGGIFVVSLAVGQLYFYVNGWHVALSLVILAFGEMASSPRIQEYISGIAPPEKVGLYMGYSFLPVAGGNVLGGLLSGKLYGSMSDKFYFLRDYLVSNGYGTADQFEKTDDALLFNESLQTLGMDARQLNMMLYETYQPGTIWLVFAGIGFGTCILLFLYNKFVLPK
jgi:dipeptide/tripeptide permease